MRRFFASRFTERRPLLALNAHYCGVCTEEPTRAALPTHNGGSKKRDRGKSHDGRRAKDDSKRPARAKSTQWHAGVNIGEEFMDAVTGASAPSGPKAEPVPESAHD